MPSPRHPARHRAVLLGTALLAVAACGQFDMDFRNNGADTSQAARTRTAPRPQPDNRGLISYPGYQVALARRGDTVADVAARVGLPAAQIARYNGIPEDVPLRQGELLALPARVSEPSPETGAIATGPIQPADNIDITTLAGNAIERAGGRQQATATPADGGPKVPVGPEPVRHKVQRGETAFSIARLYNVSVRALADWNGLGPDLTVREGQYLLIPVPAEDAAAAPPPQQT
ncbi:MAG: LysM peptidoglycan-binding domain-containing protein, partial [Paracoccaceae bacterium]